MPSTLVIVESPAKAKTIEKYLPDGYRVLASLGHVRDLPDNASQMPAEHKKKPWAKLGVNTENGFEAFYVVKEQRAEEAVANLKDALSEADELILATDEDREGEAISWHLLELLAPSVPTKRMVFHEITKTAINDALKNTRTIDMNLVEAQETRRILDRLVGYPLSLLVGKKIKYGLSAGRVQSAAVRLLVERERERRRFKIGSYWDIKAELTKDSEPFTANLHSIDGTRLASGKDFDESTGQIAKGKDVLLLDEDNATELVANLASKSFEVSDVVERQYSTKPKPPFTTSTLQQEASRKLGMSAKQAMSTAQRLYENGHITYMRTDSINLSKQAVAAARTAAKDLYGDDYIPEKARFYSSKSKNAQEAHEAIRPSGDAFTHPDKSGLSGHELKLYRLIWERTVACQMADARRTSIRVDLEVEHDGKVHLFRANGNRIDFPGYIRADFEGSDDPDAALENVETILPEMVAADTADCERLEPLGHETRPPSRYTEASLVRALEEAGIGRPSTYASIMDKISTDGRYAEKQGRTLVPTYMAFAVTKLLEENFPELVEREFTAKMEDDLDEIATGKVSKVDYLHRFYRAEGAFDDKLQRCEEEIDPEDARRIDLEDLPVEIRVGRYGPYIKVDHEVETVDVPDGVPPADLSYEMIERAIEKKAAGPETLGEHPETGETIYVMDGRYGAYVQLGEKTEENPKPKRASIPDPLKPESISREDAIRLLSLPREVGEHPESGKKIEAGISSVGPYLRHKRDYRSVKSVDILFDVTLEEAVEIFSKPKANSRPVLKELGDHPETEKPIEILKGRYGPYIKMGRTNVSLPKGEEVDDVTLERAVELIAEKQAKKSTKKKSTKKKSTKKSTSKKSTAKKTTAKKSTAKKTTAKKTTTKKKTTKKASPKKKS
jgi:DNA topoisomerase-1